MATHAFMTEFPHFVRCAVQLHDREVCDEKDASCMMIKRHREGRGSEVTLDVNCLLARLGPTNDDEADLIIRVVRQRHPEHPLAKIMLANETIRPTAGVVKGAVANRPAICHAAFQKRIVDALEANPTPLMMPLTDFFVEDIYLGMFDDYPNGPFYPYMNLPQY